MGYPDKLDSWADAIHAAQTPLEKAVLYLQRALEHGSRRLIAADIDRALGALYSSFDAAGYLRDNRMPWTQRGLHKAARRLLKNLSEKMEVDAVKDKRGWRVTPAYALPDGFELWEQDDHCVDLYHGKEHVAVFSAAAATERVILEACREYLGGGDSR